MIPIKIIITKQNHIVLDSIDDTVESLDVSGSKYSDLITMRDILDTEHINNRALVEHSSETVERLHKECKNTNVDVFYLTVCGQFMFIVKDGQDVEIVVE